MNHTTLQLYLYMGNSEPIIKWLKDQGVKTQEQAANMLRGAVGGNLREVDISIWSTNDQSKWGSHAGTALALKKILKEFKE